MSIFIVWGHPGEGKTYSVTAWAIDAMKAGRPVFSNYPIIWKGMSSMKWKPEYAKMPHPPVNAVICIDEAYRYYNSREFKNFSVEEHTYFATNRHNNLEIYLIAQNPARLDKVIQEISQFILCRKIGFLSFILGFRCYYYEFLEDLSRRRAGDRESHYRVEFRFFSKKVANAYDTHYFGVNSKNVFIGECWEIPEEVNKNGKVLQKSHLSLPDFLNFYRDIFTRMFNRITKCIPLKKKKTYDLFE